MANSSLTIQFSGMQRSQDVHLGPFPAVRIAGNFMRAGPDNHVIAAYARHFWELDGQFFASYQCRNSAVIYFEDHAGTATERFGPYDDIRVADGTMYAGDRLFAKFIDESILWHSIKLETWWPTLVIEAT